MLKSSKNTLRTYQDSITPANCRLMLSSINSIKDLGNSQSRESAMSVKGVDKKQYNSIKSTANASHQHNRKSSRIIDKRSINQHHLNHAENANDTNDNKFFDETINERDNLIKDLEQELISVRSESDMYKEKIKDLEKWLVMFLNNFYEGGDPKAIKSVEEGLQRIEELRQEKYSFQKAYMQQHKLNQDLQQQFAEFKFQTQLRDEEIRKGGEIEQLIVQKSQLEQTLVSLSEEVEILSQKNEKLLKDLKSHEFYEKYYLTQIELERLQISHDQLIQMLKVPSMNSTAHQSQYVSAKQSVIHQFTPKSSFICGLEKGSSMSSPRGGVLQFSNKAIGSNYDRNSIQFENQRNDRDNQQSFFSFLSCGGCSANGQQNSSRNHYIGINQIEKQSREEEMRVDLTSTSHRQNLHQQQQQNQLTTVDDNKFETYKERDHSQSLNVKVKRSHFSQ
ncbi:UNKNOWN [Stylonychia lemnae]|uniref:Uncharacterized protein n=1 Tax=Stylonychia lemnae TaxID=5949 RepID=A0A078B983_STYLE|nr:UNKNOWN [Stylonychia lemnae]|eukprot:CDW89827.1 UNKNOWN [Stylonychia lemnae]